MKTIRTIFRGGAFEPLGPINLNIFEFLSVEIWSGSSPYAFKLIGKDALDNSFVTWMSSSWDLAR